MVERFQLYMEFDSLEALSLEIEQNLKKGRAYVAGHFEFIPFAKGDLVLVHPLTQEWMPLSSEAVYAGEGESPGIGLLLLDTAQSIGPALDVFLHSADLTVTAESSASVESLPLVDLRSPPQGSAATSLATTSLGERVRRLDVVGRDKLARHGSLSERIALERAYGPAVWEPLLSNPLLSSAEISKVAKNHTASQPILQLIVGNSAWIAKPEVRRALLSNPRLSPAQVEKTLHALPLSELKLVVKQPAYPARVRNQAKRLLGFSG